MGIKCMHLTIFEIWIIFSINYVWSLNVHRLDKYMIHLSLKFNNIKSAHLKTEEPKYIETGISV